MVEAVIFQSFDFEGDARRGIARDYRGDAATCSRRCFLRWFAPLRPQ